MKISTASKKVLASALSAAMVVAFAPTVAFGADATATAKVVISAANVVTGAPSTFENVYYSDNESVGLTLALNDVRDHKVIVQTAAATATTAAKYAEVDIAGKKMIAYNPATRKYVKADGSDTATASEGVTTNFKSVDVTVQALTDFEGSFAVPQGVTLDLMGNTLVNDEDGIGTGPKSTVILRDGAAVKNGTVKAVALKAAADKAAVPQRAISVYDNGTLTGYGTAGIDATIEDVVVSGPVAKASITSALTIKGKSELGTVKADTIAVGAAKAAAEVTAEQIDATTLDVVKGSKVAVTYKAAAPKAESVFGAQADTTGMVAVNAPTLSIGEGASLTVDATSSLKAEEEINYTAAVAAGLISAIPTDTEDAAVYQYAHTGKVIGLSATTDLTLAKDSVLDVTATAAGDDGYATAIDATGRSITVGSTAAANTYSATLKAAANVTGYQKKEDADIVKALGLKATKVTVANGTFEASANAADDVKATALEANIDATSKKGTASVKAAALDDKKATAVDGTVEAAEGTYVGFIEADMFQAGKITGGSYSTYPQNTAKDAVNPNNYEIVDEKGMYTVQQFAGYAVKNGSDAVNNFVNGKSDAAGVKLADGVTLADLQKQCNASGDKKLTQFDLTKVYNAKKATEAEKAIYDAIAAYAKANLFIAEDIKVTLPSIVLGYYADDAAKLAKTPTIMATVTDLGSVTTGRTVTPNTMELACVDDKEKTVGKQVVIFDGTAVTAQAWAKDAADNMYRVKANTIPVAYATLTVDEDAVKDAANQKPETPAEKATQGIDVAQKSKTVKLAKGKTKTQKAVSFKLGASAETGLAIAKKSGSSRISVSGQKITLKKGTKKGTFTAKVSLKAAASDEFLAAAKTITVKFVVKK